MTINKLTVPPTQNEVIEKINEVIDGKQDTSNLVTSVSSSSTNSQYPSAKCVYDIVGNIESALNTINSGS